MHFFWIWLWLARVARLAPGRLTLLADCHAGHACMGEYGRGIARALLSEPILMPLLSRPIVLDRVKFGLGGDWPFPLWEHRQVRPDLSPALLVFVALPLVSEMQFCASLSQLCSLVLPYHTYHQTGTCNC